MPTSLELASKRRSTIYIEFIRILASFFVVYLHTGNYAVWNYTLLPVKSLLFPIELCFSVWSKIAVPMFFMISGALLLGKDESLAVVMKKRVWKYVKLIVVFSFINYIIDNCLLNKNPFNVLEFIANILSDKTPVAYWYLYASLALMLLLPFLRSIARQMTYQLFKYMVLLLLLLTFVFKLVDVFWLSKTAQQVNTHFNNTFFSESLLYFLIGYGLIKFVNLENWPKRHMVAAVALWAGSILVMAGLTVVHSVHQHAWNSTTFATFTQSLTAITAGSTICLARYFFRNINPDGIPARIICVLGKASVGVVLFEGLMRKLFFVDMVEFLGMHIPVFIAGCLSAMAVCFACWLIAWIIQHTPFLKKLL